jgi:hypothetical protein
MKRRESNAPDPDVAPDGERGGGNPRRPQRDLSREGDVLDPDRNKECVDVTDLGPAAERDIDDGSDSRGGHEADPPKPRKEREEEPREVPPHARRKSGGGDRKR